MTIEEDLRTSLTTWRNSSRKNETKRGNCRKSFYKKRKIWLITPKYARNHAKCSGKNENEKAAKRPFPSTNDSITI